MKDLTPFGLQKQITELIKKSRNQILYTDGPLTGQVTCCHILGIDNSTGDLYYKNEDGNWEIIAGGGGIFDSTVDFSVNANPNTVGTTFSPNTPNLTTVIYVSTINGSQWTSDGVTYTLYIPPNWSITGNSGTTPGTHFVGTTDNIGLMFKVNNTKAGYIDLVNQSTSLGVNSLKNNAGSVNTAFGLQSLFTNTSGNFNTASGVNSLYFNTTGGLNTAFGYAALLKNTTGQFNIGIGYDAGAWNTTASNQIFINSFNRGNYTADQTFSPIYVQQDATIALQTIALNGQLKINDGNQTVGDVFTCTNVNGLGQWAAPAGITGSGTANQVAYWNGTSTVTGDSKFTFNPTDGHMIMTKTTTPNQYTVYINASGTPRAGAGVVLLNGSEGAGDEGSVAIFGDFAGGLNSYFNTVVGYQAMTTTNNPKNIAIGAYANANSDEGVALGYGTVVGSRSTALGSLANAAGSNNISIGRFTSPNLTTGSHNSFLGVNTGAGITTGSNNTILGARVTGLSASLANNIILADGSGNQRLNFNNNGALQFTGGGFGTSGQVLTSAGTGAVPTWTTPIAGITESATLNFPSTVAGTSSTLTITVTGAADGDVVAIGIPNGSTATNGVYTAWVSAANTVTIMFTNTNTITAIDPASGTFRVTVFK